MEDKNPGIGGQKFQIRFNKEEMSDMLKPQKAKYVNMIQLNIPKKHRQKWSSLYGWQTVEPVPESDGYSYSMKPIGLTILKIIKNKQTSKQARIWNKK